LPFFRKYSVWITYQQFTRLRDPVGTLLANLYCTDQKVMKEEKTYGSGSRQFLRTNGFGGIP
jgi:hypothetical protein